VDSILPYDTNGFVKVVNIYRKTLAHYPYRYVKKNDGIYIRYTTTSVPRKFKNVL
jgi:hypothetical protein